MSTPKAFHLKCTEKEIGRYVFLPGAPERVKQIAENFESYHKVSQNREFTIYSGFLNGTKASIVSTGIGGPSAAIAMEELVQCGADTFIRIGTCGGMQPDLLPGAIIIPTGAVRMEGTSKEYMPIEFPAVPDFTLVSALSNSAKNSALQYYMGIVQCKDSFYGQHSPERMPVKKMLSDNWEAWKSGGVLASEMESAALFVVASTLHVRCATVLKMIWNQERENKYGKQPEPDYNTEDVISVAIEAMKNIINDDKNQH